MARIAVVVVAALLTWLPAFADAGIIDIVNLKSLPKSAPNNVNSTDDLIPVFGLSNVENALASIGLGAEALLDLQIEVTEGDDLGALDGAKTFRLTVAPDEFVTIKFGTNVALITSSPGRSSNTVLVSGLPNGLSNVRRFRGDKPIPEPRAALAFAAGAFVIGWALRRSR